MQNVLVADQTDISTSLTFLNGLDVFFGFCLVAELESESDSELDDVSSEVIDSFPKPALPTCLLFWPSSESLKNTKHMDLFACVDCYTSENNQKKKTPKRRHFKVSQILSVVVNMIICMWLHESLFFIPYRSQCAAWLSNHLQSPLKVLGKQFYFFSLYIEDI